MLNRVFVSVFIKHTICTLLYKPVCLSRKNSIFFQKNLLFSLKFKVIRKVSGQSNVSDIIDF